MTVKSLAQTAQAAGIAGWGRTQKVLGQYALGILTDEDAAAAITELQIEKAGRTPVPA